MIFWELLQRRIRQDGAQPLLTCYNADGARTELSAITYGNWVAKAANFIADQVGAGAGDRIALEVAARRPGHWMSLVWVGGCWAAGVEVVLDPDADAVAVVSGPELEFGSTTGERYACSLHPLALGFGDGLPDGVVDWADEVRSEPDALLVTPPMADDPAWEGMSYAEVAAIDGQSERVVLDCREAPDDVLGLVREALVAPLLGGGSSVTVHGGDPAQIADRERGHLRPLT
ncbi:TIGR03089 family protein [Propionibacteriaceae bacterium Y2011]